MANKRAIQTTQPASVSDLDWAAGLFEGEGTVTIGVRKSDETYRLIACVGSTDRQIVEFFLTRWGGWDQPAYGARPGRQPAWTWTVAGPRAEKFLIDVLPHLRTERVRRKTNLALDFRNCQSLSGKAWRDPAYKATQRRIYTEMRQLNRRGIRGKEMKASDAFFE